jgi:hypothetical protein
MNGWKGEQAIGDRDKHEASQYSKRDKAAFQLMIFVKWVKFRGSADK